VLVVWSHAGFLDLVVADRGGNHIAVTIDLGDAVPVPGVEETVLDGVVADLQPDRVLHFAAVQAAVPCVARVETARPAAVRLEELIAAVGVHEEVGEVGEQLEIVVEAIPHDAGETAIGRAMPLGGKTVALGFSAGAVIEGSEASDDRNRAAGDLVARVPVAVITHGRDGESLLLGAMAVAKHPGPLD